jgi:hypothetical protein
VPGTQQTFVITAQGLLTKPEEFEESSCARPRKVWPWCVARHRRVELDKRDYSIASR